MKMVNNNNTKEKNQREKKIIIRGDMNEKIKINLKLGVKSLQL